MPPLDDYKADLRGEYFPLDLPHLTFYRPGHRQARLQSTTNRPMPTAKKELRQPKLLKTITHAITKLLEAIAEKQPHAA